MKTQKMNLVKSALMTLVSLLLSLSAMPSLGAVGGLVASHNPQTKASAPVDATALMVPSHVSAEIQPKLIKTPYFLDTLPSGRLKFVIHRGLNTNGESEVAVEYFEIRRGLPDSSTVVIYGRDTDSNGFPDLWFIPGENGDVRAINNPSKTPDGWDVLPYMLIVDVKVQDRSISSMLFNVIGTTLSFAIMKQETFFQQLMREEMNIQDLEFRVERLKKSGAHPKILMPYYQLICDLRDAQLKKLDSELITESSLAVVDGVFFVGAPKVLTKLANGYAKVQAKVFAKLSGPVGRAFEWVSTKPMSQRIATLYAQYRTAVGVKVQASAARLNKLTLGAVPAASKVASTAVIWSLERKAQAATKALGAQNIISRKAWGLASGALNLAHQGAIRLPYVAQTAAIQIAAELQHRQEAFQYGDPIIVEQNMQQMTQNVAYMATETLMMATVTQALDNLSTRMTVCGALAFNNSMMLSFAMNGEPDTERQALDTRWEVLLGNVQTQVDIEALKFFEELAQKSGRPRLKLIGYAVALVNQYAGYRAYAWATSRLDQIKEDREGQGFIPGLQLIPIMVEDTSIPVSQN